MGKKKRKLSIQPFLYKIPSKVLDTFSEMCIKNVDSNGKQIETLGVLIGYKDREDVTATEIVIPTQTGSATSVEDEGKN